MEMLEIFLRIVQQHIHGKKIQDYSEWSNAIIFTIILNILVAFWRSKNSLENNVSHFSINNIVYQRSVGRRKKENRAQMQSWKQIQF